MANIYGGSTPTKTTTTKSSTPTIKKSFKSEDNQREYEAYVREKLKRKEKPRSASSWYKNVKKKSGGPLGAVGRFVSRVKKDVEGVVRALPQLPKTVGHMLGPEGWKNLAAVFSPAEIKGVTYGKGIQKRPAGGEGRTEWNLARLQESPLGLIPGLYTIGHLTTAKGRKELGEHPGQALLDVLPYVGKVGKLATKGAGTAAKAAEIAEQGGKVPRPLSKGQKLARNAAQVAKESGRPAKAARIETKGLKLNELAMQAGRELEKKVVAKKPGLKGKMPSDILEKSGLGGRRPRRAAELLSRQQRSYSKELGEEASRLAGVEEELGISRDRVGELTEAAQTGAPGWTKDLTDNERAYVKLWKAENERLASLEGEEFFDVGGEKYSKAQRHHLLKVTKKVEDLRAKAAQGNKKAAEQLPRFEKALERSVARSFPERFRPELQRRVLEAQERILKDRTAPEDWDTVVGRLHGGDWEGAGISLAERAKIIQGVSKSWQDLKTQGYDPVFLHQVPFSEAADVARPKLITPSIVKPGFTKRRTWDSTPYIKDATVALTAQARDFLRKQHTLAFVENLKVSGLTKTWREVFEEARLHADRLKAIGDERPRQQIIDELLKENYTGYDPSGFINMSQAGLGAGGRRAPMYVPTPVAHVLEQMRRPMKTSPVGKVFKGGTRLFRDSVLYLNPMYYGENAVSGAVLTVGRGRLTDLRFLRQARQWLKDGKIPDELSVGGPRMGAVESAADVARFRMGSSLMDWVAQKWAGEKGGPAAVARRAEVFAQNFAASIDDMWKATSYLAELKRGLKKGLSEEAAIAQAIEHAHKVLGTIDNMLPYERFAVRQVLPFYSWSKFIAGYVMSYPFDHPWRTSVISAIGRMAQEDMAQRDLPERFLTYFWAGQPKGDAKRQKLIPGSGFFPFVPVADMFSLAGLFSRLDPRLKAVLEVAGYDPFAEGPDPYRPTTVDPVSGREVADNPSILTMVAKSMVPQLQLVLQDEDLKRYYAEHPDRWHEAIQRAVLGKTIITRSLKEEVEKWRKAQARVKAKLYGEIVEIPLPAKGVKRAVLEERGVLKPMEKKKKASTSSGSYGIYG